MQYEPLMGTLSTCDDTLVCIHTLVFTHQSHGKYYNLDYLWTMILVFALEIVSPL